MQNVSDAWKEAHKQMLLPETFVEIAFNNVYWNVTCDSASDGLSFSNSMNTVNNIEYSTPERRTLLERNIWLLDGSHDLMSDVSEYTPPGFVSYPASGWSCSRLRLGLPFKSYPAIPGFTIIWSKEYEEYATDFEISVRDENLNWVGEIRISDNTSNITIVDLEVSKYTQIRIDVYGWSVPDRLHRIDSVIFGHRIVFDKNDILSYTHEQTGDLVCTELPKNYIEFSIDNSAGRWDLLNPNGLGKYLRERQLLTVRYGLDIDGRTEWINGGKFYLSEWKAPSNGFEVSFVARDLLEFALNVDFSRDKYYGVSRTDGLVAYSDLARSSQSGTFAVGESLCIYEEAYDDFGYLMYRTDRGWVWSDYVFSRVGRAIEDCIETLTLPNNAQIVHHEDLTTDRDMKPIIEKTNAAAFLQKCANVLCAAMWQDREGVVHIRPPELSLTDYTIPLSWAYSYPEIELTKPLKELTVTFYRRGKDNDSYTKTETISDQGENIILDNPYCFDSGWVYQTELDLFVNAWKSRKIVTGEFRADPRLDLFDVVTVEGKYGDLSPVMITNIKYKYNGSFKCVYTGQIIEVDEGG